MALKNGHLWKVNLAGRKIQRTQSIEQGGASITAIEIQASNDLALLGRNNGRISRLSLPGFEEEGTYGNWNVPSPINCIQLSNDESMLLVGSGNEGYLFRTIDEQLIYSLYGHEGQIKDLAFSGSDDLIFSASLDGKILQWAIPDIRPDALLFKGLRGHGVDLTEFDSDFIWLATSRDSVVVGKVANTNEVFAVFDRHQLDVTEISASREWVISGDQEGVIYYWSIQDPSNFKTMDAHFAAVRSIIINGAGDQCITAAEDGLVLRWSLPDGALN